MGRKVNTITLTEEQRSYLELQTRARTIQAQTVCRARILLLRADGVSINDIADKVGINRCSVMLCLNKFKEGGVENALFDAPGRGRNAEITDDEKTWIINIACQKPVNLGYSAEVWTRALLTKHINKFAENAGYTRLSTISQSKVRTILEEADNTGKPQYIPLCLCLLPYTFEKIFCVIWSDNLRNNSCNTM
jgi:transposase